MAETNQNQTGGMFDNKSGAQPAPAQQPQQNLSIVQKDVVDTVLSKIKDFEEAGELKLPSKRLRDSILSPFFHSYIFAMYKNEALWI